MQWVTNIGCEEVKFNAQRQETMSQNMNIFIITSFAGWQSIACRGDASQLVNSAVSHSSATSRREWVKCRKNPTYRKLQVLCFNQITSVEIRLNAPLAVVHLMATRCRHWKNLSLYSSEWNNPQNSYFYYNMMTSLNSLISTNIWGDGNICNYWFIKEILRH